MKLNRDQKHYESIHKCENKQPVSHSLARVDRRDGPALADPNHILAGADRPVEVGSGRRDVRGEGGGSCPVPEVAFVQRLATASADVVGGEVEVFEFETDDAVVVVLVALREDDVTVRKWGEFVRF